jgi:DNA-binding transcriptional LysR family regulator
LAISSQLLYVFFMIDAELDWSLWRTFLAIVREGSLAGAGRETGVSHPTVRRHLEALEAALKAPLFTRSPSGLEPTGLALDLRPVAEAMEASSRSLLRRALSERDELVGVVRISASEIIAVEVLPDLLATLRNDHPRLSFEIHPTNRIEDILRGDADIAVRMTRPRQESLIARRVAEIELGLFAAPSLLDRLARRPDTLADAVKSGWMIGYDRNPILIKAMAHAGIEAHREDFRIRSDNDLFHLAAVRAGLGLGFVQAPLARRTPRLIRLAPEAKYTMEAWLAVHPQLAGVPRIASTMDALGSALGSFD